MGYTHYWRDVKFDNLNNVNKKFKLFKRLIKKNYKHIYTAGNKYSTKQLIIQREYDIDLPIELTEDYCVFNGEGEQGHETFYIIKRDTNFNFCKTARKPYDFFVTAYLMLLADDDSFSGKVSTDGNIDDWEWCYNKLIHYELVNKKLTDLIQF